MAAEQPDREHQMVTTITVNIGADLYEKLVERHSNSGLNRSEMIRYAIAIDTGFSAEKAFQIAIAKPTRPIPEVNA